LEIDDAIIQLGAKLDAWLDGNLATIPKMDRVAQLRALLAGVEITKELDHLKAKGLQAIADLLKRRDAATESERIASLIRGFEFAAKLADTLHDELLDVNGETAVLRLRGAIVDKLDTLGSGRAALAVLLDHADAGVRAQAGASLLRLMPERVLPILREIEGKENWESAGFRAHWAIVGWEREGKHGVKPE
jgi:hypothetical protein